ncbi:glycosyltransferase family 2 protein [Leuconostoc mesenteroides]|uniref:glycosyltransferase family 2 protein n=1 Tax=Leuconostoc mesenteroides TaxID=1245 RepID=UPI001E2E0429|nr:glycosyltransferase family 2 protein [Leuconostoc mesenteroides]
MNERISIIIPVYQEKLSLIKQSIDSIKKQTYANIEILVGLDDPTNVEALNFLRKQEENSGNFSLFVNSENLGLSENLNKLIQRATGRYIARMDADDIADSERLEKQYNFLKANNLNFVSGAYDSIDEDGNVVKISAKKDLLDDEIRIIEKYGNILTHPLWLVSRKIMIALKYRKVEPVEDYDLVSRAMLNNNIKFGYMGESLLKYRIRNKSESHRSPFKSLVMTKRVSKSIRRKQIAEIEILVLSKQPNVLSQTIIKIVGIYSLIRYKIIRMYVENIR